MSASTDLTRRNFLKTAVVGSMAAGFAGGTFSLLSAPKTAFAADEETAEAAEASSGETKTGQATIASMKGDITVFVTMDGDKISKVDVFDDVDTPTIRDVAIEGMTRRIVEHQSVNVDTVTGATMTSMAIANGVAAALESIGFSADDYKKTVEVSEKNEGEAEDFDLVVVGSGMAGLNAAITARREGVEKVLVVEKQAYTGGSTRVCGGGIWAVDTHVNEIAGQNCSYDDYASFMENWSQPTELNTGLLENIHKASLDAFTYLYNWGLPVQVTGWSLGNPEAQLPCFWSVAGLATAWETGNSGIADFLAVRAEKDGVEIRLNSKALELVTEDGAVTGVKVEDEDKIYVANAKKVILASGGFTRNADLIKEYAPDYEAAFPFTGGGSTGDGITMTKDLGVQIVGEGMMGLFGLNPGLGYYGELGNLVWQTPITVNAEGETFDMEEAFYGKTLKLLLDQTGACGYGIVDSTTPLLERFEKAVEKGYVNKYDTLDELAEGEGIDAENLKQSAEEASVSTAPFFCIIKKPLFIGSIPGLKVSADCEVLGSDDTPIANLFAAGELIFGNAFSQAYPCSGTGVATSCYTGAVAAKKAASNL